MKIILATNNKNKVKEIKQIFNNKYEIFSLEDLNINIEPDENGNTFEDNSFIKAKSIYNYLLNNKLNNLYDIILSDDSGFCIDYFNGKPGIKSSRFLGENVSYNERFDFILSKMKNVPFEKRKAYFISCICMIDLNEEVLCPKYFIGRIDGFVAKDIAGTNGFGYDPIFYLEDYKMTFAEITPEEKNKISHRYIALKKLSDYIIKHYGK